MNRYGRDAGWSRRPEFYERLTGWENLRFAARTGRCRGAGRTDSLFEVDTASGSRAHDRLARIRSSLEPKQVRAEALAALDELFASGEAPDPAPEGFKPGQLVTMALTRPTDAAVRVLSSFYMPWLGKSFDPSNQSGVNHLKPSAATPMSVLWRNYTPERAMADRIEAFPFRTRIEPGTIDPGVNVLKIDYDYEANPAFIIRRILDELVQIDEGLYLGKILFRTKKEWRPLGFFSLLDR